MITFVVSSGNYDSYTVEGVINASSLDQAKRVAWVLWGPWVDVDHYEVVDGDKVPICHTHPRYRGKRKPRAAGGCAACDQIFSYMTRRRVLGTHA